LASRRARPTPAEVGHSLGNPAIHGAKGIRWATPLVILAHLPAQFGLAGHADVEIG
jgi:hypothetical protein